MPRSASVLRTMRKRNHMKIQDQFSNSVLISHANKGACKTLHLVKEVGVESGPIYVMLRDCAYQVKGGSLFRCLELNNAV